MAAKYTSSAKIVDGILVLSLPDAIHPVVWQMELGQSKSSALEIRDNDHGEYVLTLKTPRQDVLDIAIYADRDDALQALMTVAHAMESGRGQLHTGSPVAAPAATSLASPVSAQSGRSVMRLLKKAMKFLAFLFGGILVLALVLFLVGKFFLNGTPSGGSSSSNAPVSAEEFLQNQ